MTHDFYDIIGDGVLHTNGIVGLISRNRFMPEELPDPCFVYVLSHPRRRHHTWVLANIEEITEMPQPRDNFGFAIDELPEMAFVYFCAEPEFDYLTFEDDEYDTYIEWNSEVTLQDIIDYTEED